MEGPYFILDGKKYHWYNVHTHPAQLGPSEVTSVSNEERIGFFGELNPFSNFHPCVFVLDRQEYHSTEQFIQATKAEYFGDNIARERILRCEDAMDSKEISMDISNFNKREWSRVAEELCYPGIKAKFFQNPGLMAALLNTGTKKNWLNQASMISGELAFQSRAPMHWMKPNGNQAGYLAKY